MENCYGDWQEIHSSNNLAWEQWTKTPSVLDAQSRDFHHKIKVKYLPFLELLERSKIIHAG